MKRNFILSIVLAAGIFCCQALPLSPEDGKAGDTPKKEATEQKDVPKKTEEKTSAPSISEVEKFAQSNGTKGEEKKTPEQKDNKGGSATDDSTDSTDQGVNLSGGAYDNPNEPEQAEETTGDEGATQYAPQGGGGSMLSTLLALIALCLGGFAVYKTLAIGREQEKGRRASQRGNSGTSRKSDMLAGRIDNLEDQIAELKSTVNALRNSMNAGPSEFTIDRQRAADSGNRRVAPQTQATGYTYKYATYILNGGFSNRDLESHSSPDSLAILAINGNRATFKVDDNPACAQSQLTNINYGVARIATIDKQSPNPTRIINVRDGVASLQGDTWVIEQKAEVRLV